ncbi:damage-inducible protein DinB [Bacillus sp. M6-12]|uniref:DinB family protein n=1 Tax=Bacillus sp. M6-12 TaxID=2054166 RepID=UPI000C78C4D9|nr:DinB family protein [Bacillus sp. M6-12]PLS17985.1 damage-inducible protein DinB [Bacillus sp. M6-12]
MDIYLKSVFNQLEVANRTIISMIDLLRDDVLDIEICGNKRTFRQLLSHMAVIYKADWLIMNGASQEEMDKFYAANQPMDKDKLKEALLINFDYLTSKVKSQRQDDLDTVIASWWGAACPKYEWLLQIISHMYHHRAQLHTALVQKGLDPKIQLFE